MSQDFTTERYREILASTGQRFRFVRFDAHAGHDGEALWRHDIDFSPQRAVTLARIEGELGVVATYFVQVSSRYYSVFEPETASALREIAALGHDIGLHFDADVLAHRPAPDYDSRLAFEARVLEEVVESRVGAFSLHNPTALAADVLDGPVHAGLFNASHAVLREEFSYCSDSNGLWRDRALADVLQDPGVRRLYVLTHPEWWQEASMLPRERIQRCIDGRAQRGARHYDDLLARHGRPNVGEVTG